MNNIRDFNMLFSKINLASVISVFVFIVCFLFMLHINKSSHFFIVIHISIFFFAAVAFFISRDEVLNKSFFFIFLLISTMSLITIAETNSPSYVGWHMLTLLLLIRPLQSIPMVNFNRYFIISLLICIVLMCIWDDILLSSQINGDKNYLTSIIFPNLFRIKFFFGGYGDLAIMCATLMILNGTGGFNGSVIFYLVFFLILLLTGSRSVAASYCITILIFYKFKSVNNFELLISFVIIILLIASLFQLDGLLSFNHRLSIVSSDIQSTNIDLNSSSRVHLSDATHNFDIINHNWLLDFYKRAPFASFLFLIIISLSLFFKVRQYLTTGFLDSKIQKIYLFILISCSFDFLLIPTKPTIATLLFIYFGFYEYSRARFDQI